MKAINSLVLASILFSSSVYADSGSTNTNTQHPKPGVTIIDDRVFITTSMSRKEYERLRNGWKAQPARLDRPPPNTQEK
jgi:hypothetical protein